MPAWAETFRPFTLTHAGVVLVVAAITTAACLARRRLARRRLARRLDVALGLAGVAHWAVYSSYAAWRYAGEAGRGWDYAVPLQLCDLASLIGPLAWLTDRRWLGVLLVFWGLGLSTQAFVTPVVEAGPGRAEFWMFFAAHTFIVGGAIYEIAARGLRPTWRDWRLAAAAGLGYVAVTLPLNLAVGSNFGYTGRPREGTATLADALGPWPLRVVWIVLLALLAMALVVLPFRWVSRGRGVGTGGGTGVSAGRAETAAPAAGGSDTVPPA